MPQNAWLMLKARTVLLHPIENIIYIIKNKVKEVDRNEVAKVSKDKF